MAVSNREGRALDCEMARLLGRVVSYHDISAEQTGHAEEWLVLHENGDTWEPLLPYSTDWSAAWLVLKHVQAGWGLAGASKRVRFEGVIVRIVSDRCLGILRHHGQTIHGLEALWHLEPADICHAALEVLRGS